LRAAASRIFDRTWYGRPGRSVEGYCSVDRMRGYDEINQL
jgi:hypothetical protein